MPKKAFGENDKKKGGNAQKAEAAAAKAAAETASKDQAEAQDWGKGTKNSAKKYVSSLQLSSTSIKVCAYAWLCCGCWRHEASKQC